MAIGMLYDCARDAEPVPAPAGAARPRLHDAAEPRADGLDAHRPRGPRRGLSEARRVLRGARARRRRAHRDRRHRAERGGLDQAVRRHAERPPASRPAPARHRRGARGGRAHLHADPAHRPLRLSPARRRAVAPEGADLAVHAARAVRRAASAARSRRSCARAVLAREAGYDGVEIMGSRGLLHQPVPGRAHQPAHRPLGRQLGEPHALADRDRARATRAAVGRGLHPHLPAVDARPRRGRQQLGRGRRTGAGGRATRARRSSTPASAGTRRASRRSRRWCRAPPSPGSRAGSRARSRSRSSPATASTTPPSPSGCWRRATPTSCRWRGRCSRIPEFVAKAASGPRGRDQHLHRLQPGLPRPRVRERGGDLPREPARRPRDGTRLPAGGGAEARRGRRRGAGGTRVRDDRGADAAIA